MPELGKSLAVSAVFSTPAAERAAKAAGSLASHQVKLFIACATIRTCVDDAELPPNGDELFDQILTTSTDTGDLKFRGMYVDLAEDGSVLVPQVSEADARGLVELVGRSIVALTAQGLILDGSEDPAQLAALAKHIVDSPAAATLAQQADADPIPVLQQFRALMRDEGPVPKWLPEMLPPGTVPESDDEAPLARVDVPPAPSPRRTLPRCSSRRRGARWRRIWSCRC